MSKTLTTGPTFLISCIKNVAYAWA